MFEAGAATALGVDVIPLLVGPFDGDVVPAPLTRYQTLNLTRTEEVRGLLDRLTGDLGSHDDVIQQIVTYFGTIDFGDELAAASRASLMRVEERLKLLSLASDLQRRLFMGLRDYGQGAVCMLESEIREKVFLPLTKRGLSVPFRRRATPSEYYYRLREMLFIGLLDMEKVSEFENRWSIRAEVLDELDRMAGRWQTPKPGFRNASRE